MGIQEISIKDRAAKQAPLARAATAAIVAGTLDLAYAIIAWGTQGVKPISIPQSIASGIMGKAAYRGGIETALLGLLLHFGIAMVMAMTLYLLAQRCELIRRHIVMSGTLFGLCCYAVMNYLVVPLSAAAVARPPLAIAVTDILAHILLVGIPMAWLVTSRTFAAPR